MALAIKIKLANVKAKANAKVARKRTVFETERSYKIEYYK